MSGCGALTPPVYMSEKALSLNRSSINNFISVAFSHLFFQSPKDFYHGGRPDLNLSNKSQSRSTSSRSSTHHVGVSF